MTDKQIKEGIDVSQCKCYSVENNSCNNTLSGSCMKEKCQTFRLLQTIKAKEQECEKLKQNARDTYDLWQALIESFNILQGEKIKLEQECEELEETNNTLTVTREKLLGDLYIVEESLKDYTEHYNRQSEEVDQLKTENEKLKKELSTYGATGICETCTEKSVLKCDQLEKEKVWLQRELIQYEKDVKDLSYFATKLKQTLLEIKEIAKPFCNTCQEFELEKSGGCIYCNYGKILQKINECGVENAR